MIKRGFSGHHVLKIAHRNGWRKPEPTAGVAAHRRPWKHPDLGTLESTGETRPRWIHRDPTGYKVAEYRRLVDALFALHPDDPDAP